MIETLILLLILLGSANLVLTWLSYARKSSDSGDVLSNAIRQEFMAGNEVAERVIKDTAHAQRDAIEKAVREEFRLGREEAAGTSRNLREEVRGGVQAAASANAKSITDLGIAQKHQLELVSKQISELTNANLSHMAELRSTVDSQLHQLQENNEKKLDEMRRTVDEKLQGTLEKRLGESFKLVGNQLEAVQRGLGEMQNLATGVGDLKRVLSNVKARGTWGEIQLGTILEQILIPAQFEKNVKTKDDSDENVEYAIRLPGSGKNQDNPIWLPIDSKFPHEDYHRFVDAVENAQSDEAQRASAALLRAVRSSAKSIKDKYLNPPHTTDFAILFLPTEGLYAEVLRHPGIVEELQQNYRIVVAGPTTLAAILNSLRMGFQTHAIEHRASEVWTVLAAVKTEFEKFGDVLDKVKRQLNAASNTIEQTGVRTRAMERKLRSVEQLPTDLANEILDLPEAELLQDQPTEETVADTGKGWH